MTHEERARKWWLDHDHESPNQSIETLAAEFAAVRREALEQAAAEVERIRREQGIGIDASYFAEHIRALIDQEPKDG